MSARKSLGPSLGRTLTPTDGSRSLRYKVVSYYRIILALLLAGNMTRSRSTNIFVFVIYRGLLEFTG